VSDTLESLKQVLLRMLEDIEKYGEEPVETEGGLPFTPETQSKENS